MAGGNRSASASRHTTDLLSRHISLCHQAALGLVTELSEDQFRWRPPAGPQSIGWNLWHIARWDDFLAEVILERTASLAHPGPATQVWTSRNFPGLWGLRSGKLGVEDAGTGLTDAEAIAISLPDKERVVEYVVAAFDRLERVVGNLDDALLVEIVPGSLLYPSQAQQESYGDNLLVWIEHGYEHLGTMEALKGMIGLRGSVGD